MSRLLRALTVASTVLLFGLVSVAAAADDEKDKEKPKNAATLDDATATLTEMVDGKPKESKVDLKHCLKVKGYFDDKGFHLEDVDSDGPAMRLSNNEGGNVQLEKGDTISEVDGKKIKSAQDYVKAMNGAADPKKVKIKVRDVRTGDEIELTAEAEKRGS
jgi:S1-C subfamily serine protease